MYYHLIQIGFAPSSCVFKEIIPVNPSHNADEAADKLFDKSGKKKSIAAALAAKINKKFKRKPVFSVITKNTTVFGVENINTSR
jgi:hypothetical protein